MKNFNFKAILPHIIAVVVFLIVAVVYCKPALEGKVVLQHDIQGWRGMSQQSVEFHEKYGYYPLWTNSMFSGMPAYQIAFDSRTKLQVGYLDSILKLGLPKPISFFFLASICFYFLCVVVGASPWISIFGGLAYAYSSFDPVIVAVGHDSQMLSIGYMPAVLAGLLLLFQKNFWSGFALTAFFAALLIGQNHLQIVYYTLIIAGVMTVAFLVKSFREKLLPVALKSAGLGLLAGALGLACNAVTMMPTYEYSRESMRGGRSELTQAGDEQNKTKGGLDKDYAFNYSLGIGEIATFIVPSVLGGSNGGNEYNASSKFAEKLSELGVPEENAVQYANAYSYWGDQPITSGPVYLGAIVCFLFIFGLVYLRSWDKWWIVAAAIVGILLAWGSNFKSFNYFLFDYLPFYNKFRATTMALVIPQLCLPLLAVLSVDKLIRNETPLAEGLKKLKLAGMVTGVILLLLAAFYFTASFSNKKDEALKENLRQMVLRQVPAGQQPSPEMTQQANQVTSSLSAALQDDRRDSMGGDLLRSLILIALVFGLLFLFIKNKISPVILIAGLVVLIGFDMFGVATRYLNSDNFVEDSDFESAFTPTAADQQILQDPDHANFRVFNSSLDAFNDASTSYHHNSVGGYHPAKLALYNDIITRQLSKGNMQVFDMLNTKYFIVQNPQNGNTVAQLNPDAYGNAWLVRGIKYVEDANAEMAALDNTNLKDTAIVEKKYEAAIKQSPVPDSSAFIKLKENKNDVISYSFHSATPQFAVLSEIYYPAGWNVFVDGNKEEYVKTNYLLRGMYIPAGDHQIEFRFEPTTYTTGRTITIIANIIVFIALLAALVFYIRRRQRVNAHLL